MALFDEVLVAYIVQRGLPGDGATVAEIAALRAELATYRDRPYVDHLDDLVTGEAANTVPVRQADGSWTALPRITGIPTVTDGTDSRANVTRLIAGTGLDVTPSGAAGEATMQIAPNAFAAAGHQHNRAPTFLFPFGASGNLSAGSRTVVNGTLSGLDPGVNYDIDAELHIDLRGAGSGAGKVMPTVTVAWIPVYRHDEIRTVGGIDGEWTTPLANRISGGNHAVSASIAYRSGDPTYVGAGWLKVTMRPER